MALFGPGHEACQRMHQRAIEEIHQYYRARIRPLTEQLNLIASMNPHLATQQPPLPSQQQAIPLPVTNGPMGFDEPSI